MIRTIVMKIDDTGDSACLDKENEFFLEDSIRWLLNDLTAKKATHNGLEIVEIGNLEREEQNAVSDIFRIANLPSNKKDIILEELDYRGMSEEDKEEMINKYRVRDLHDKISDEAIRQVKNYDPLFDTIYEAIREWVKRYYGEKELQDPSWSMNMLADYITYKLKGKA